MSKADYYFEKHMNDSVKEAILMLSEASRFISFAEEYAASNGEFEELRNLVAHCDTIKENLKAFLRWEEPKEYAEIVTREYDHADAVKRATENLCGEDEE